MTRSQSRLDKLRVVVIGAGIAGASVTRALAERGATVRVVDAVGPVAGASGAAAGALHPLTGMRLALRDEHFRGFELTTQWLEEHPGVASQTGILRLVAKESQAKLWRKRVKELGSPLATWRSAEELRADHARLTDRVLGGVFIPRGTFVDVERWVRETVERYAADCVFGDRVVAVEESGNGAFVRLESGTESAADIVVVCAGTGTRHPLVDVKLEWDSYKGELGVFRAVPRPPLPLNHRGYIAPWGEDTVLIGVLDSHPPFSEGVRSTLASDLLKRASQVWSLDGYKPELVKSWSGVRPALKSRNPVVGPTRRGGRVWLCTGHGGRGLLTAPLCAASLADRLAGDETTLPDGWWFSPS